ncbi:MAG: antitoxin AF2212-like protein [bacterium]
MGKFIRARIREGRIEPAESVQLPPDGTEVLVSLEEADRANEWFRELHRLFTPMRAELAAESEEAVDERIAQAVKVSRARKRGKA